MIKTAHISECGRYRFELSRTWDPELPKVLFVMLNPSTADSDIDDPTIRRCIGFAKSWGYGGIMVGNMFAYRSTDPWKLKEMPYHGYYEKFNTECVVKMHYECQITVFAFGNSPIRLPDSPLNGKIVNHLGLTKSGNPKHPLYLKSDLKPTPFVCNF